MPTDSNIAQSNPEKFAQMLSEKLQRFKDEQDKFERITTSLHSIDVSPSCAVKYFSYINSQKISLIALQYFECTCRSSRDVSSFSC